MNLDGLRLSAVIFFVSGLGIIAAPLFFESLGLGPWIAARVFLLFGLVMFFLKK